MHEKQIENMCAKVWSTLGGCYLVFALVHTADLCQKLRSLETDCTAPLLKSAIRIETHKSLEIRLAQKHMFRMGGGANEKSAGCKAP